MIPNRKQWNNWSLPSKLTAIGAYVGVFSVLLSIATIIYPYLLNNNSGSNVKNTYNVIVENNNKIIHGCKNEIFWDNHERKISLPLNIGLKGGPSSLNISRNTPNGTKIMAIFEDENVAVNLFDFSFTTGFSEWGDINTNAVIHVCEHDLDYDNKEEIIVSVREGYTVELTVYKFHQPHSNDDLLRIENWKKSKHIINDLGEFAGLKNNIISLYGGASDRLWNIDYAYVNDDLIML